MGSLEVRVVGADRLSRVFLRMGDRADSEIEEAVRETANGGVRVFRQHAPRDSGRLHRGITAHVFGKRATVTAEARDPRTGYSYVGVTRFGHRIARIVPRSAKVLRFTVGGRTLFRAHVRGYHPAGDWAERALPQISGLARLALDRAGRRIAA